MKCLRKFKHNVFGENLLDNKEIHIISLKYYYYPDSYINDLKRE